MNNQHLAWHFLQEDGRLRDGQAYVLGTTYRVDPPLLMCKHGLHWNWRILDALQYAQSSIVTRVRPGGEIIEEDDKGCSTERTAVAGPFDASATFRYFARWCASQVADLWRCPPIVRLYLETGDESIRDAARDAAWAARGDDIAAARRAKYSEYNDKLETMLKKLMQCE